MTVGSLIMSSSIIYYESTWSLIGRLNISGLKKKIVSWAPFRGTRHKDALGDVTL